MNESTFIGLANNAALLVALGLVFDTVVLKPGYEKTFVKILTGIVFGILGIAVMMTPWEFVPGVIFDTRSVILSIGGLFFGILPTLIAVLMTSALRIFQGGIGAWTGTAVIITSGFLGILWRHKRKRVLDNISLVELYIFGIVVHIAMLLWMFSLPWGIAKGVLSNISLPVMILYPIGTVLLGKLMITRLRRKKEGDALLHSEARWRSLTETSPDHILTLDTALNIQFANFTAPGLTVEELIGTPLYQYVEGEDKQSEIKAILENALLTGEQKSYETVYNIPDGETIYYESTVVPRKLKDSAEIIGLTVSSRNITERKQAEEQIKSSLKEKQIMIDEIHHRVKNNMNVISSLLSLQANNIEDDRTKDILKDSQNRIFAMSAIHETLHGSENLSEIDLKKYLSKITASIFQSSAINPKKVKLKNDITEMPIAINQASPLGLVANELISNSLKYAFPDEREGEISVSIKKLDKELELTVMDNGVGIPDGLDWKNSNTLGLKLVRTLVENQLDGSIDMESKNGTKFIIKFNIET
jgi:PAS domain S-box-containing protein